MGTSSSYTSQTQSFSAARFLPTQQCNGQHPRRHANGPSPPGSYLSRRTRGKVTRKAPPFPVPLCPLAETAGIVVKILNFDFSRWGTGCDPRIKVRSTPDAPRKASYTEGIILLLLQKNQWKKSYQTGSCFIVSLVTYTSLTCRQLPGLEADTKEL